MGKKKKQDVPETGELLVQSPEPKVQSGDEGAPVLLEYRPHGTEEVWKVERFDLLATDFELTRPWMENMGNVQEALKPMPAVWLYVRRIYGVMPLIAGTETHLDDTRTWTRQELAAERGVEVGQVSVQLEAARRIYDDYVTRELDGALACRPPFGNGDEPSPIRGESKNQVQEQEIEFPERLLERYAFDPAMFELEQREPDLNRKEMEWFCQRIKEFEKMLDEPKGHSHAREAILLRLYLHRLEPEMGKRSQVSKNYQELAKMKRDFSEELGEHLEALEGLFPELGLAGKISFRATIDALNLGLREFYGNKDRRLLDHLHSSAEVEVLLRQSVQSPNIQYRFGLNMAILEAQKNLYNAEWRSSLSPRLLKKLDVAFAAAVNTAREASGEALVDLEKDGPEGEYPDLKEHGGDNLTPMPVAPEMTK